MESPISRLPLQAPAWRRLLHLVFALAGWVLGLYWWWIVFQRVSRRDVIYTCLFIAVTVVITVLVTVLWAYHNKRLHRRKQPRQAVRPVGEDYSRDTLLRTVAMLGGRERIQSDPFVQVQVEENRKVYRPSSLPPDLDHSRKHRHA